MFVSLKWIRDYVDLPPELDPHELAERFTLTTAEVEGVERIDIGARGLIAARVVSVTELPDKRSLRAVVLDAGGGNTVETVTAAPVLHTGSNVVYAPPGSYVRSYGDIGTSRAGNRASAGMVLPADALGIAMAVQEAVFVGGDVLPGQELPGELFDDWVIEIDNKSITHRPDLWGHYGVAREIAAIHRVPLKPCPFVPLEEADDATLPEVPISPASVLRPIYEQ